MTQTPNPDAMSREAIGMASTLLHPVHYLCFASIHSPPLPWLCRPTRTRDSVVEVHHEVKDGIDHDGEPPK